MADGTAIVEKPKHPGGRPTSYRVEYCEAVVKLGSQGYSRARMAAHFGVSKQTLADWAKQNPEFSDALVRAMTLSQAHLEEKGYSNLGERNFNTPLYLGMMKSMFREDYMDRSVQEIVGKDGEAIEFKDNGADARKVAFMLGRAIGRQEKSQTAQTDSTK